MFLAWDNCDNALTGYDLHFHVHVKFTCQFIMAVVLLCVVVQVKGCCTSPKFHSDALEFKFIYRAITLVITILVG